MHHAPMADTLTMRWTPVTGADGRTRMESRWVLADHVAPLTAAPTPAEPLPVPTLSVVHAA